ncbi:MAG: hypothetical protein ABSH51_23180, partial [Solirubrobacteraceae bacterium]
AERCAPQTFGGPGFQLPAGILSQIACAALFTIAENDLQTGTSTLAARLSRAYSSWEFPSRAQRPSRVNSRDPHHENCAAGAIRGSGPGQFEGREPAGAAGRDAGPTRSDVEPGRCPLPAIDHAAPVGTGTLATEMATYVQVVCERAVVAGD